MVVGVRLIHKTEPMPEPFFKWFTWSAFSAEIPFAQGDGFILCIALKIHRNNRINRTQRCGAVAADIGMAGMFSGKQRAARSIPNGCSCIKLREPHTFSSKLIKVRSLD